MNTDISSKDSAKNRALMSLLKYGGHVNGCDGPSSVEDDGCLCCECEWCIVSSWAYVELDVGNI